MRILSPPVEALQARKLNRLRDDAIAWSGYTRQCAGPGSICAHGLTRFDAGNAELPSTYLNADLTGFSILTCNDALVCTDRKESMAGYGTGK